jgi:site-specific recombinase XerC
MTATNRNSKKAERAISTARHLMNQTHLGLITKRDYKSVLDDCVKLLHNHGYFIDDVRQLKQKHIYCLVGSWKQTQLTTRTIKNKLSVLRCACRAMHKPNVVLSNPAYALPVQKREDKQRAIFDMDCTEFRDLHVRYAIALQQAFGLRREEAMKFNVHDADKGHYIDLKPSWTKGGIGRDVPITTAEQRALLDEVRRVFGKKNLIMPQLTYIQQRRRYDDAVKQSRYHNLHGLRHAYAQQRYQILTGWAAPKNGGKPSKALTEAEKRIDREARLIISRELGHARLEITKTYIG